MLNALDEGLYTAERWITLFGIPINVRMTVVRLPDGRLWVHSPVQLDDALRRSLDALGKVAAIIAPNTMHHLYIGDFVAAYPDAVLHAAEGLAAKRKALRIDRTLGDRPDEAWGGVFDTVVIGGMPAFNESVFIHRPTRTLIATDTVFNVPADVPWRTRFFCTLTGTYKRFACSRLFRSLIRDKAAFARSMRRVIAMDYDRVIMAHGRVLQTGGGEAMRRAYEWLPGESAS